MKSHFRPIWGAAVFLFGCATGGAASHYLSVANAAPRGVTTWSYTCFKHDDDEFIAWRASKLGKAGWELAASALSGGANISSPIWCFKRPL